MCFFDEKSSKFWSTLFAFIFSVVYYRKVDLLIIKVYFRLFYDCRLGTWIDSTLIFTFFVQLFLKRYLYIVIYQLFLSKIIMSKKYIFKPSMEF